MKRTNTVEGAKEEALDHFERCIPATLRSIIKGIDDYDRALGWHQAAHTEGVDVRQEFKDQLAEKLRMLQD